MELTKLLHALLVCLIQEEIALFDSSMHVKAQAQTGVINQLRVNVMDQSLMRKKQTYTHRRIEQGDFFVCLFCFLKAN